MYSYVLYCPELDRDLRGLLEAVPDLEIFYAERTQNGADGCLHGHQTLVAWAQACGLDCIFVMEDDCQFTKHFHWQTWCRDADWAAAHGYDVLAGGCTRTYEPRLVRTGLIEVSAFHSAHCVVYFASGYDKVLRACAPLDWSLGRDCQAKCVVTYPFVAVQHPTYSGIEERNVNYLPFYEQHEKELAKLLGVRP